MWPLGDSGVSVGVSFSDIGMAVHLAAVHGDRAGGRAAAGAMWVGLPEDGLQLRENRVGILDSELVVGSVRVSVCSTIPE